MGMELDNTTMLAIQQKLSVISTSNPEGEALVRKIIAGELAKSLRTIRDAAKGAMKSDPRQASKAIRRTVYKRILGGNLNILQGKARGGNSSYQKPRTLQPGQRGGNRRKRSADTERIDSYTGLDRSFVLRFLNSGVNTERETRYGKRGTISARGWFEPSAVKAMEDAARSIARIVDDEVKKILNK